MPSGRMKQVVKKEDGDERVEEADTERQVIRRRLNQGGDASPDEMQLLRAQAEAKAIESMEQVRVMEKELLQANTRIAALETEITMAHAEIQDKNALLQAKYAELHVVRAELRNSEPAAPEHALALPAACANAAATAVSFFQEGIRPASSATVMRRRAGVMRRI